MKYNTPNMEIMQLDANNIILTSVGAGNVATEENEPTIPPSQGDDWS